MRHERNDPGVTSWRGKVVVVGGFDANWLRTSCVEAFNRATGQWQDMASLGDVYA